MDVFYPWGFNKPGGEKDQDFSLNFDYSPSPTPVCRIEGRMLNSKDDIFELNGKYKYRLFYHGHYRSEY